MSSSLENIQVGDLVKIQKVRGDSDVTTVTHVTPKQFIAGGYQFWKKDGRSLRTFGYTERRYYASIATPEEIRQHEDAKEQWRLACELADILREHGSKIPLETLRELSETVKGFMPGDDDE